MSEDSSADLIVLAAARAASRPFFLASALAAFQELRQMSDEELWRYLGCSANALNQLRLCRRPDADSPEFQHDVRLIGDRFAVETLPLVRLLREVASVDAMRGPQMERSAGFLIAARDKPPRRQGRGDKGNGG